ncbi:MAG: hypothetical protein RSA96_04335 [Erysipelotrichaceae bacterium]
MKIIKREASIVVLSNSSNEFPDIVKILSENKKYPHLNESEYAKLDDAMKGFLQQRFSSLFSKSASEWNIIEANVFNLNSELNCELCGKNNLKYISKIKNKINGIELTVGSNCIEHYNEFKGIMGEEFKELSKKSYKLQNEKLLEKRCENILLDFDRLGSIKRENRLLNLELTRECKALNEEKVILESMLSKKTVREKEFDSMVDFDKKLKNFFCEVEKYLEFSENDEFGINRRIVDWIFKENYDPDLVKDLQKKGRIDKETIKLIKEPFFLKKMVRKLIGFVKNDHVLFDEKLENSIFYVTYNELKIKLCVSNVAFINRYCQHLFSETNFEIDIDFIIKYSYINQSASMRKSLQYILFGNLDRIYNIEYEDDMTDELAIYNSNIDKIQLLSYTKFVNKFIKLLFVEGKENDKTSIINFINENSELYSKKEYRDHLKKLNI